MPPGVATPDEVETLLLPPGYEGEVPEGYHVVHCPTYSVWPVWRSFLVDGDPKPGVDAVKKFTKIYPLSQAADPPKLDFVDMSGKPFNMVGPSGYHFWEMLHQVVQEEPTDTVDPTTLGFWASVGIQKGKPSAFTSRSSFWLSSLPGGGARTGREWSAPSWVWFDKTWRPGEIELQR